MRGRTGKLSESMALESFRVDRAQAEKMMSRVKGFKPGMLDGDF